MGDIVVLEFVLGLLAEGANKDGVVLRRNKRDCVQVQLWWHPDEKRIFTARFTCK